MSLNQSRLKTALKALILANIPSATETNPVTEQPDDTLDKACDQIAKAIVDEVANNLTVQIPIGAVIVSATGGSFNIAPIDCDAS